MFTRGAKWIDYAMSSCWDIEFPEHRRTQPLDFLARLMISTNIYGQYAHTHTASWLFKAMCYYFFLFAYRWAVPGLTFLWWWASHQVESQGLDLQQCRLRTRQTHRHTAPWDSWWCLRCQVPFMYGSYCGYLMIFGIWHVTVRVFFCQRIMAESSWLWSISDFPPSDLNPSGSLQETTMP